MPENGEAPNESTLKYLAKVILVGAVGILIVYAVMYAGSHTLLWLMGDGH